LRALLILAEPGSPLRPDQLPAEIRAVHAAGPTPTRASIAPAGGERCSERLDDVTKQTMRQTLAMCGGNVSEAARRLGINRSTLYRRLLSQGP
jgi:transcriptional regulator of acetoin/glycerol metabolism